MSHLSLGQERISNCLDVDKILYRPEDLRQMLMAPETVQHRFLAHGFEVSRIFSSEHVASSIVALESIEHNTCIMGSESDQLTSYRWPRWGHNIQQEATASSLILENNAAPRNVRSLPWLNGIYSGPRRHLILDNMSKWSKSAYLTKIVDKSDGRTALQRIIYRININFTFIKQMMKHIVSLVGCISVLFASETTKKIRWLHSAHTVGINCIQPWQICQRFNQDRRPHKLCLWNKANVSIYRERNSVTSEL